MTDGDASELTVDAETRTRIQEHLFDEIPEIKPLTTNEIGGKALRLSFLPPRYYPFISSPFTPFSLPELGLKTTQLIVESSSPLSSLVQLSQDFPRYAHSIAQLEFDTTVRDEINSNQRSIVGGGANGLWLNGLSVGVEESDPFRFVEWEK